MFKEMTFIRDSDSSSKPEQWLEQVVSHVQNNQPVYRANSDATVFELTLLEEETNSAVVTRLSEMAHRIKALETRQAFLVSEIRELRFQLDLQNDKSEPEADEDIDEFYDEAYFEAMELKKILP